MKSFAVKCLAVLLLSAQMVNACYAVTLNAFIEQATQECLFQKQSTEVALTKNPSPQVQAFAKQATADHQKLFPRLKQLGEKLRMDVPTELSVADKARLLRLESRDDSFDRIYIESQTESLQRQVMLFKKETMQSENPELKAFAQSELVDLEKQAEKAQVLREKLKPSAGALTAPTPAK